MKIGVQLFGVLASRPGQTLSLLEKMAEKGLSSVEPCISLEPIPGMEHVIWPISWVEDNLENLQGFGIKIDSAHLFAGKLQEAVPAIRRLAEQAGLRQVVLKTPTDLSDASLQQAALDMMKLADELESCGVEVLLHNESHDIAAKIGGQTAYEHMMDLCLGKVNAQVDVGWVLFAGENVEDFLQRNRRRIKSLHYKDFPLGAKEPHDVPVGTGGLDLESCLTFARAWNIPQIIDQEHFEDPVEELLAVCERISG